MTDLITCYKLLNGELDVDCYSSIHSSDVTQTRGNTTQQVFVMQSCFTTVLLIPETNCLTVLCWPLACLLSRLVYINLLYCKYWLTVILYSFVICNVVRIWFEYADKYSLPSVCMYGTSVSEGLFLPWCPVNIFKSLRPTCIHISVICTLLWLLCTSNVDK